MATTFNLTVTLTAEVDNTVKATFTKVITDTTCNEFTGLQYAQIATGTTDEALPLGSLTTAYVVALISDQAVSIKANGSATALTLRANEPVVIPNVTALTITNASGSTANVQYIAVGA